MRITDIRYDGGKNRFIVETEGPRFFLSYETYDQYKLKKDLDISEWIEIFENESLLMEAREYVYGLVARRAVSSHEVEQKLQRRNIPKEIRAQVLAFFFDAKLIDDGAYLQAAVQDQIQIKGFGPWRIVSNLRQKGFDKTEVLQVYHSLTSLEEESQRARDFFEKRWPQIRAKTPAHKKKKMSDQLLRQGFSYDTVSGVMEGIDE